MASESITVKATDSSDTTKTATVPVTISVSDVNDVTPSCTGGPTYAQYSVDEEQNGIYKTDQLDKDIIIQTRVLSKKTL